MEKGEGFTVGDVGAVCLFCSLTAQTMPTVTPFPVHSTAGLQPASLVGVDASLRNVGGEDASVCGVG